MATTKPTTVAVVGCGYWGPNLARNLSQTANCQLGYLCDASPARLQHMQKLYPSAKTTPDLAQVIADPAVDAVVVATPVRFHYDMAKAALDAGKHVFIEKPMARSVAECEELNALGAQKGLVVMVGHTFLFSPPIRKMKEIIDRGDIGDVLYVNSRRLNLGLYQKDINVAWDLAPHDLSIILHFLQDRPNYIACSGSCHVTPNIEDVTTIYLSFERQRCAIVQSSWLDPRKVREMTVVGSRRMIVYDDTAPLEKIKIYDARVETPPHYDTFAEFNYSYHYGDVYAPYIKQDEPLKLECAHFIECIREGKTPLTSGVKGLEVVRILEASSKSLKQSGAAVMLNGK